MMLQDVSGVSYRGTLLLSNFINLHHLPPFVRLANIFLFGPIFAVLRDGSSLKSTDCSCKRPKCCSQYPFGAATPATKNPTPSSGLCAHVTYKNSYRNVQ